MAIHIPITLLDSFIDDRINIKALLRKTVAVFSKRSFGYIPPQTFETRAVSREFADNWEHHQFTRATCGESEPEMVITLLAPRLSAIVEFRERRSDHYAPPQPAGDPP